MRRRPGEMDSEAVERAQAICEKRKGKARRNKGFRDRVRHRIKMERLKKTGRKD